MFQWGKNRSKVIRCQNIRFQNTPKCTCVMFDSWKVCEIMKTCCFFFEIRKKNWWLKRRVICLNRSFTFPVTLGTLPQWHVQWAMIFSFVTVFVTFKDTFCFSVKIDIFVHCLKQLLQFFKILTVSLPGTMYTYMFHSLKHTLQFFKIHSVSLSGKIYFSQFGTGFLKYFLFARKDMFYCLKLFLQLSKYCLFLC